MRAHILHRLPCFFLGLPTLHCTSKSYIVGESKCFTAVMLDSQGPTNEVLTCLGRDITYQSGNIQFQLAGPTEHERVTNEYTENTTYSLLYISFY